MDFINATASNMSTEWVAGGMVSSPADLLKFAIALRDGKLLSPSSLAFMRTWKPVSGDAYRIGHNIMQWRNPYGVWLGHNGSVLGFTGTLWWLDQDAESDSESNATTDCAVCVLANVGTMHTSTMHAGAQAVMETNFLDLAKKLSNLA